MKCNLNFRLISSLMTRNAIEYFLFRLDRAIIGDDGRPPPKYWAQCPVSFGDLFSPLLVIGLIKRTSLVSKGIFELYLPPTKLFQFVKNSLFCCCCISLSLPLPLALSCGRIWRLFSQVIDYVVVVGVAAVSLFFIELFCKNLNKLGNCQQNRHKVNRQIIEKKKRKELKKMKRRID